MKVYNSQSNAKINGNIVEGGSIWTNDEPPPIHFSGTAKEDPTKLEKVDSYFAECLSEHLTGEFPSIFNKIANWTQLTKNDISEELIDTLSFISHGGMSEKYTCKMCKSWYESS
jgi:hypothetical protein